MKKGKTNRLLSFFIIILMITCILAPTAHANSAEPPGLTVIASFPPDDLTLSIRFADGSLVNAVPLEKETKVWEAYYRFFYWMTEGTRPSLEGAMLVVQSSEKTFECPLPASAFGLYNNLITLDFANESVAAGQSPVRSFLLISMRVILTLLIEGLIFYALGYRSKASWITFIAVNLLTQGALNMALSGPNLGSYWILAFAFYEMIIFIAEAVAFALILKEQKKGRAIAHALTANLASLILGGLLISQLPI